MKRPGVCRRKNTPSHFSRSRSAFVDRFPPVAHESLDVGFDVEAVLVALEALDLVERDIGSGECRGGVLGRSECRDDRAEVRRRDRLLETLARQRDDRFHFGPAGAASG